MSSGHALLVALFGTGQPVKPKPYRFPQKFDDSAHPKYGTLCSTRYDDAERSGVTVGMTANTPSCSTSFFAAAAPVLGSAPSSLKPRYSMVRPLTPPLSLARWKRAFAPMSAPP